MEAITAFLNGDLDEKVFIEQKLSYELRDPAELIFLFGKVLSGLKEASPKAYAKIDKYLTNCIDLMTSSAGDCFHVKPPSMCTLTLAFYVDELLIACNHRDELGHLKMELCRNSKIWTFENRAWYLGETYLAFERWAC